MKNLILIFLTVFFVTASNSQEKKVELKNTNKFNTGIGVVDMKKILGSVNCLSKYSRAIRR